MKDLHVRRDVQRDAVTRVLNNVRMATAGREFVRLDYTIGLGGEKALPWPQ